MPRRLAAVLLLGAVVSAACVRSRMLPAPAIPDTPAGRALREWLDAFNSADTVRMDAYYELYQPEVSALAELPFRVQTGGFELLTIERSDPRHAEFTLKERRSATTAYGILEVSSAAALRVTAFRLQAMGASGSPSSLRIDSATRARVIDGALARLDEFYVFPEVAKRIGDSLRARQARGEYDGFDNGMSFAMRLDGELRELAHDKHMRLSYTVHAIPLQPASPASAPRLGRARRPRQLDAASCGFERAELLPGVVGYLKFNAFADPDVCGAAASAAMSSLADTRALVIDLRDNSGGDPRMVAYVSSYLFSHRTHLNDLWTRATGTTDEYWTRDDVPGRRFGGKKPVYVLTSSRTFSGAEEFSYNLKTLGRATIVGETTGGGAHPVSGHRIDEHFVIGVPFARAINPISHTNWEGVGVEPDVKVPAAEALVRAQQLIHDAPRRKRGPMTR